jgi:hypothetical protein
VKTTLATSGEIVKTTLATSGELRYKSKYEKLQKKRDLASESVIFLSKEKKKLETEKSQVLNEVKKVEIFKKILKDVKLKHTEILASRIFSVQNLMIFTLEGARRSADLCINLEEKLQKIEQQNRENLKNQAAIALKKSNAKVQLGEFYTRFECTFPNFSTCFECIFSHLLHTFRV